MAGTPLCLEEREEIRAGIERGESAAAISRRLCRHRTTISREIARNGGRETYRATKAQRRCVRNRRRPKPFKLVDHRDLAREIEKGLRFGFSPGAIAALLRRREGPRVVHETIYRALYSPVFRGIGLLPRKCLRSRRPRRRRRDRVRVRRPNLLVSGFRLIDERPASALDREEPGHWEGDLILGTRDSGSAVATLVERTSRLVLLAPLFHGYGTHEVRRALGDAFAAVPSHLRRSLTWDQGTEMYAWPAIEDDLQMPIFLCHPRSPWERGSNENTNRQIRYWLPKRTNITAHPAAYFERIALVLNSQPRRLLGWSSAQQRYRELAMR